MTLKLEQKLHYHFKNQALLAQALTHRSLSGLNNERLEFMGDAVLNYLVAKLLYRQFPHLPEGDLSRIRAHLVNQETLAAIAAELDLGQYLRLGAGEIKTNGRERASILSDALEAIFAAVTLDTDINAAEAVISGCYQDRITHLNPGGVQDAKSRLQEQLQAHKIALPLYEIAEQSGADHQKMFTVNCLIPQVNIATQATASSRRKAEQKAAQSALCQYQDWLKTHA